MNPERRALGILLTQDETVSVLQRTVLTGSDWKCFSVTHAVERGVSEVPPPQLLGVGRDLGASELVSNPGDGGFPVFERCCSVLAL
ncbi:hypothetical protein QTO34_014111 [Cnephaeus nilssonii]|uniref:Uncharacterized protein n=1 Tax=Cnephaeus nilssonii TaxID=3371016 RepID=A0AA40I965_CNENI|nr:hypothetical protein QTO34_014111 [Eptesicus nilssonii]